MKPFSVQTIAALGETVTGGSFSDRSPSIGHYRSGPQLERFFRGLGIALSIGNSSRVPTVHDALVCENESDQGRRRLVALMEANTDPRDYIDSPEKLNAVVEYMNKRLAFDGFELRKIGNSYKLVAVATNSFAVTTLTATARALDLDSVNQDFQRAMDGAESDPEDAITSACATVESTCKSILDELGVPYPSKKDVQHLAAEVAKHLGLSPTRTDLPPLLAQDLRQVLGGLQTVANGIGALRTHFGDAHGRGRVRAPVDARIARLAIHAASTISLFYIETWQRRAASDSKE